MGDRSMRIGRNQRPASAVCCGEIKRIELVLRSNRSAAGPVTAEGRLLVTERGAVPDLDPHPGAADRHIGSAAQPGRRFTASPDHLVHDSSVLCIRVARAVLESEQIARSSAFRVGRSRPLEAFLGPAEDSCAPGNPGQVADRMEGDLQIVGACLHA
ncbi:hypothetical protein D3C73_1312490 [compost metagenome]